MRAKNFEKLEILCTQFFCLFCGITRISRWEIYNMRWLGINTISRVIVCEREIRDGWIMFVFF